MLNRIIKIIKTYPFPIVGYICALLVMLIPFLSSIDPLLPIILYRYLVVLPIIILPFIFLYIDYRKNGNDIRGFFLGFSISSLTWGFLPYYDMFWLGHFDFRYEGNMLAIFRSIYFSGSFAIYERIISYLQNLPLKRINESSC
jgi:uncharacterized membrane protein